MAAAAAAVAVVKVVNTPTHLFYWGALGFTEGALFISPIEA